MMLYATREHNFNLLPQICILLFRVFLSIAYSMHAQNNE